MGSEAHAEFCARRASNSLLIRSQQQNWGDDQNPLMSFFGRLTHYLRETVAGNGSKKLRAMIGFYSQPDWKNPKFAEVGIEGGEGFYIEGGAIGMTMEKFSMYPPESVSKREKGMRDECWFVRVLEDKTVCGFIPHPDNPKRPQRACSGSDPWYTKRHIYFMKGYTANADIGVTESGPAFLKRTSD